MNAMIQAQTEIVAEDPTKFSPKARANATGSPFSNQDSLEVSETQPQIE